MELSTDARAKLRATCAAREVWIAPFAAQALTVKPSPILHHGAFKRKKEEDLEEEEDYCDPFRPERPILREMLQEGYGVSSLPPLGQQRKGSRDSRVGMLWLPGTPPYPEQPVVRKRASLQEVVKGQVAGMTCPG